MIYRKLGRTGLDVSEISLGTEYLIDIPEKEAIRVIRSALDRGINYFDLFFAQPVFRDTMGKAFAGRRDKAILTTHLGATVKDGQYDKTRNVEESEHYFHDFLTRYNTDYTDILFLHNCDSEEDFHELMRPGGLYESAIKFKKQGKCRHIAFSSHTVDISMKAIAIPEIEILMFPVNMASHAVPGKEELYRDCRDKNTGLVAMKPYAGGKLLQEQNLMEMDNVHTAGGEMTLERKSPITAAQCLSYSLSRTGISCIVPGCASIKHLDEAMAIYEMTPDEKDYSRHLEDFGQFKEGECTYCNHCLPCPMGIDIGQSIRLLDWAGGKKAPKVTPELKKLYDAMETAPGACIRCGACEARCPFGVSTMDLLADSARAYTI